MTSADGGVPAGRTNQKTVTPIVIPTGVGSVIEVSTEPGIGS